MGVPSMVRYEWPDLTFPPINLWNVPKQNFLREAVMRKKSRSRVAAQENKRETLQRLLGAR